MNEIVKAIISALKAPVGNVLIVAAVLFLSFAFIGGETWKEMGLLENPNPYRLSIAACLLIIGVLMYILSPAHQIIHRKVNAKRGLTISVGSISVNLKIGNIQEIQDTSQTSAIVLPANTSFIDDCIRDKGSALGAFFLERFAKEIDEVPGHIRKKLEERDLKADDEGLYPFGTTIIMSNPFDKPCPILLTASTVRKLVEGIRAKPTAICECIRNIFETTSDKKINKLYMPILGAGHGGIKKYQALIFLIVSIAHYERFYHHIKQVEVVIREQDLGELKKLHRLQYFSLLTEER
ncbi:MAG: hypothetical protein JRH09_15270 [Deltaproteobacteria bacterium]|nr:hypothetical protein [Deltaproteobacteria bacterium]